MSRPGGQNDDVVRGAGVQMAKGFGLILVAVIIGIVLLQIVDADGKTSLSAAQPKSTTTTVKVRTTATKPTTTTKKATTPTKAANQVRVEVVNAGAKTGSAKAMANALKTKGYTNQPNQPTDWTGKNQKGNTVLCKAGFQREAVPLAMAVGAGTQTPTFPKTAPPSSTNIDCVVAVGG
ncbi:MAG: hypothetical protein QOI55_2194 [Actinomycetota bacterium]|nr:hypothetical protein [Actinomycetota bacterium]